MDQKVVVGVGNIYACEALFRSQIKPQKMSRRISKAKLELLVKNIKLVLGEAIRAGGSTISDFKQAGGDSGYFQHSFDVYGKEGEPCEACESIIKNIKLGGRSSFYCPQCQKS
jgi:formamidopyrimidine-DNA glycosylase